MSGKQGLCLTDDYCAVSTLVFAGAMTAQLLNQRGVMTTYKKTNSRNITKLSPVKPVRTWKEGLDIAIAAPMRGK
jgi:hypothetical protein